MGQTSSRTMAQDTFRSYIALVVMEGLATGALLACSAVLVMRRQKRVDWRILPIWAIMAAIWSWAWQYIWIVVVNIIALTRGTVYQSAYIYQLLSSIFSFASTCLLFCAFYRLVHITLALVISKGRTPSPLKVIHWIILGIIVAISIASVVTTGLMLFLDHYLSDTNQLVTIVQTVICWAASWEITAIAIFILVRVIKTRPNLKNPALALLGGSVLFSALNFMWAVDSLRWYISINFYSKTEVALNLTRSFVGIILSVMMYVCITGYCLMSDKLSRKFEETDDIGINHHNPHQNQHQTQPWVYEADSHAVMEADTYKPIAEADGSYHILEADGSRPIYEADSGQYEHKVPR